ncbi:hemolysin family protein [Candidatus Babeliales bacterium]|nr:hemolysin family protein [Candidatus Babeliales bacterium]
MSLLSIEIILFFVTLFFAGLFAFLETAFTALRLFKVKELQLGFSRYKNLFASWEKNPQRILITILIANNFAHVSCSVLIAEIMEKLLGKLGLAIGVAIATIMILIFGEIIPKTLGKTHNERLFKSSLWLINILYRLLYPIVTLLLSIASFIFAKLGKGHILEKEQDNISEKEIEFLIDYSDEKGLIEAEKSEMLQNIFSLGQTVVNEIMVPKSDMILINADSDFKQVLEILAKYRFSRLPVFEGKEDNIIGIIHHKDILNAIYSNKEQNLKNLVRPVLFVPETQKINQLLSDFLEKKMHLAVVIDEYGEVIGLVTLEDIIEEIVGEIQDEHENIRSEIVPLQKGGWIVDAKISLEKLSELLDIVFEVEDSITLGGFLSEKLQHLPKKGERLSYKGYCFQIQQANPRRVFQVLVFKEKEE